MSAQVDHQVEVLARGNLPAEQTQVEARPTVLELGIFATTVAGLPARAVEPKGCLSAGCQVVRIVVTVCASGRPERQF